MANGARSFGGTFSGISGSRHRVTDENTLARLGKKQVLKVSSASSNRHLAIDDVGAASIRISISLWLQLHDFGYVGDSFGVRTIHACNTRVATNLRGNPVYSNKLSKSESNEELLSAVFMTYGSGGPAGLAYGFLIAWFSSLSVYLVVAEMASM